MKLRTKIAAFVAVLVASFGLATPAHAATGYDRCEEWGWVCIFTGLDGGGTMYILRGVAGQCINMVGGGVNSADSFFNKRAGNTSHHVQFYDQFNCTGQELGIKPWTTLGPFPSGTKANFTLYNLGACCTRNHRNKLNSVWFNNG